VSDEELVRSLDDQERAAGSKTRCGGARRPVVRSLHRQRAQYQVSLVSAQSWSTLRRHIAVYIDISSFEAGTSNSLAVWSGRLRDTWVSKSLLPNQSMRRPLGSWPGTQ